MERSDPPEPGRARAGTIGVRPPSGLRPTAAASYQSRARPPPLISARARLPQYQDRARTATAPKQRPSASGARETPDRAVSGDAVPGGPRRGHCSMRRIRILSSSASDFTSASTEARVPASEIAVKAVPSTRSSSPPTAPFLPAVGPPDVSPSKK